jgi:hypothetical protein
MSTALKKARLVPWSALCGKMFAKRIESYMTTGHEIMAKM